MKKELIILMLLLSCLQVFAQKERRYVRDGNEHYEQGYFMDAEAEYNRAIELNPESFEAAFNKGNALFRQEKFEDASRTFGHVAENAESMDLKASAFHNQGNSYLANQDLESAIEAYKNALRIDPSREDSRYNLAWAQRMLKQQQEQEQENQENEDQNQDENQGEDGQEGEENEGEQDQQEGENSDEEGEQKDDQGTGDEQEEQSGSEEEGKATAAQMTQEEMERLLQSLIREEQNTQDKVNKKKLKGNKVKTDKDW